MHPPSLVEETSCLVQMLEVAVISLASEEVQTANLEIAPEVAGTVAIGYPVIVWLLGAVK